MEILSWIIMVGPKCNHVHLNKRDVEGNWATQRGEGEKKEKGLMMPGLKTGGM